MIWLLEAASVADPDCTGPAATAASVAGSSMDSAMATVGSTRRSAKRRPLQRMDISAHSALRCPDAQECTRGKSRAARGRAGRGGARGYTVPVADRTSTGGPVAEAVERARSGGPEKYHQKLAEQGKLFVRERLRLLLDDEGSFAEEGLLVSALAGDLPADGVVTGVGQ